MTKAHDLVVVGGGLAGAALSFAMARKGKRVLVLERETAFRDRVRGEGMNPWGVAEARELGIFDALMSTCAREVPYWTRCFGPMEDRRNLVSTTPHRVGVLTFVHPEMQEVLLAEAAKAGAEVRRGAVVRNVVPGARPHVAFEEGGAKHEVAARLVVAADGRSSPTRAWGGFAVEQDPQRVRIAGVLLEGAKMRSDSVMLYVGVGALAILFPLTGDRVRAYYACHKDLQELKLAGAESLGRFVEVSIAAGVPAATYADAKAIGPLATFEGADSWVDVPYANGVALLGDAAACTDPTWGQGLSLTLRGVRLLRDSLLGFEDWDLAGKTYAAEQKKNYDALHAVEGWVTELFMTLGPEADARRARAMMAITADPSRLPDVFQCGPTKTLGEADRRRFFGVD